MAFNHFDDKGQAVMVDVSAKQPPCAPLLPVPLYESVQ